MCQSKKNDGRPFHKTKTDDRQQRDSDGHCAQNAHILQDKKANAYKIFICRWYSYGGDADFQLSYTALSLVPFRNWRMASSLLSGTMLILEIIFS